VAGPLNPIFMLGGAPEAHEVLSKTPQMQVFPLLSSVLPKAFPIKASDYTSMWIVPQKNWMSLIFRWRRLG
jgi:hypothetical protein